MELSQKPALFVCGLSKTSRTGSRFRVNLLRLHCTWELMSEWADIHSSSHKKRIPIEKAWYRQNLIRRPPNLWSPLVSDARKLFMLNEQHVLIGYSYGNAWIIIQLVTFSKRRRTRMCWPANTKKATNPKWIHGIPTHGQENKWAGKQRCLASVNFINELWPTVAGK